MSQNTMSQDIMLQDTMSQDIKKYKEIIDKQYNKIEIAD